MFGATEFVACDARCIVDLVLTIHFGHDNTICGTLLCVQPGSEDVEDFIGDVLDDNRLDFLCLVEVLDFFFEDGRLRTGTEDLHEHGIDFAHGQQGPLS